MLPVMKHPLWLAIVPAGAFLHVLWNYLPGTWAGALWICNLSALLLTFGLLLRSPLATWIAVLWATLGTPLWLLDALITGEWTHHSWGVHLVCPLVGLFALRGLPPPAHRLAVAIAYMLVLQAFCRLATPASMNVNMAFGAAAWAPVPFLVHWLGMFGLLVLALLVLDKGFQRIVVALSP